MPISTPNLFNCAIGVSGIYDLLLMHDDGDIPRRVYGEKYLSGVIGNDELI